MSTLELPQHFAETNLRLSGAASSPLVWENATDPRLSPYFGAIPPVLDTTLEGAKGQRIIALYSSVSGSGKSTVANLIQQEMAARGKTTEILSFATALRKVCAAVLTATMGLSEDDAMALLTDQKDTQVFYEGTMKLFGLNHYVTPRKGYLIPVGDAVRDFVDPNAWVHAVHNAMKASTADVIVIDDLRRQNEYDFLFGEGAEMVRVISQYAIDNADPNQGVEGALDNAVFDALIYNSGGLDLLNAQVIELLNGKTVH